MKWNNTVNEKLTNKRILQIQARCFPNNMDIWEGNDQKYDLDHEGLPSNIEYILEKT